MTGAGAGAMLDAIRRQRRMASQMRSRRARARDIHIYDESDYAAMVVRADHACLYLCEQCRYLQDHGDACDACGSEIIYDLGVHEVAEMLRDEETEARMRVPRKARRLTHVAWVLLSLMLSAGLVTWYVTSLVFAPRTLLELLSAHGGNVALFTVLALALTWPLTLVVAGPISRRVNREAVAPGFRWRTPIAPTDLKSTSSPLRGTLSAEGDPITAPFSERPCLAYQVQVIFDIPGDNHPPQRILLESGSAALRVGSQTFAANQTLLDADEPTALTSPTISDEALREFLRARGFYDVDGTFTLQEARVEAGDEVELHLQEGVAHITSVTPASGTAELTDVDTVAVATACP